MIIADDVLTALQERLNADTELSNLSVSARKMEVINEDPNRCPWVCVYKGEADYNPRALGNNPWQGSHLVRMIVQASSMKSGEDCGIKLDDYVSKIIDAINRDKTLGGTVEAMTRFTIKYGFIETSRSSLFFQSAIVTLTFEGR